jgi:uncharacterized Fe-S cluster protein YjdI
VFLVVPLGDLAVFAGLVGSGLALRKRPDFHRRLMLLSCIGLLPPAVGRLPFAFAQAGGPLFFFGFPDLCMVACAAYDTWKNRRLHPPSRGPCRWSSHPPAALHAGRNGRLDELRHVAREVIHETPADLSGSRLTVTFDPEVCKHSGVCLMALPAVFDVRRKRWIHARPRPPTKSRRRSTAAPRAR